MCKMLFDLFPGLITETSAVYCRYTTTDGRYEFTYCMEKCCL